MRMVVMVVLLAGCAAAPGPDASPAADRSAWTVYRCESGGDVAAAYPSAGTAVVRYGGETVRMSVVVSGSGARYAGGGYEWWTRGSGPGATGRLGRFAGDEVTASQLLEDCAIPAAG